MAKGIQIPTVQTGLEASISDAAKRAGPISLSASIDPSSFKRLAQPLGKVSGLATEFEKSIAASNARVIAFGASVGIINGIQNAFTDLVRTTVQVEKSLANIAAISGKTVDELKPFGKELFNIARQTSQSFETASQAALEFSRQGLSVEETLKRTTDALTLTRFTTLSAAEAVDVLTAAANSFGDTGITTAEIINKLVAVDTKFAVSAEDLANGLARAGSIAQEVGVSFDELNAAITVAQERTARGGAVIGNALKTIFTRLRSDETVQALRSIGVESLNAQGGLKGAVPLLQEVAIQIKNLSEGERIQILEAIASKYNINILSALLNDLNTANSKFADVVGISAGASNEAYKRQIELNKILDSQINAVTVSVKELFNTLGQIGVTENLSKLLGFVNDLLTSLNKVLDSKTTGGKIARGLIDGLSDVLFSVGLPLLAAIFVKLTKDIAQFGVESLKTILGINQQVRERQALEQAVVNTLIRDQEIMATILSLSGNRAKQEEYLLGVYNRQLAALQQVQNIATSVAPALQAGGLSATSGRVQRRAAGGYLPNQEASDVRRGVGGAGPSSKVVSIPNFAFGGGKRGTMVANTSEYIVPNFANGGSAIFNQDMVKAYGLPAGARKISAAGGYVPNFAKVFVHTGNGPMYNGQKYVSGNALRARDFLAIKNISYKEASGKEEMDFLKGRAQQINEGVSVTAQHPQGSVMLIPKISEAQALNEKSEKIGIRPKDGQRTIDDKLINSVRFSAFGVDDKKLKSKSGRGMSEIEDRVIQVIGSAGARIVNDFKPLVKESLNTEKFYKIYDQKQGARGSASAVAGSIFEAATDYALNPNNAKGDTSFDVQSLTPNLIDVFSIKSPYGLGTKADYKISQERARDFADQIILNRVYKSIDKKTGSVMAAKGYIPNFAAGGPLEDAISREMAAGISPNKIRVTQDGRLRNSQNPQGLAVINTRDEPNGKIPNFASNDPRNIKRREDRAVQSGRASYITDRPTTTDQNTKQFEVTTGKLMTAFVGLQIATSTLQSTFKNTDSVVAKALNAFGQISTTAAGYGTLGSLGGEALKGRAGILGKAAGYMGPAGIVLGAGIGVYETIQESKAQEKQIYATQGKSYAQRELDALRERNLPERQAITEQQELVKASFEAKKQLLESRQAEIDNVSAAAAPLPGESEAQALDKAGKAFIQVKSIQEKYANLLTGQENKTTELITALRASVKRYKDRTKGEAELEKNLADSLRERVALTTQLNSLNEAAAAGENIILENRAKRQSNLIRDSVFLTETQKNLFADTERLVQLEEKRDDLKKSILLSTVKELSSANLGTVEKNAVENLRKRLEAGEDILDIEKELLELGIEGNSEAAIKIKNALSEYKIGDGRLVTEKKITAERQAAIRDSEKLLKLEQLRVQAIEQSFESEKNLRDAIISGSRGIEEAAARTPLAQLENQVATQPFATREQEAQLATLRAELQKVSAQRQIDNTLADAQRKIFDELQNSVKNNIKSLSELGDIFINNNIELVNESKNVAGLIRVLDQLKNQKDAIETVNNLEDELGLPSTVNRTKLAQITNGIKNIETALAAANITEQDAILLAEELNKQVQKRLTFEVQMAKLREKNPFAAGVLAATNELERETEFFNERLGRDVTVGFRDGLRDALGAAISQTDDLNTALQNIATNFLKKMQDLFLEDAANNLTLAVKKGLSKGFSGAEGYSGSFISSIGSSISKFFTSSNTPRAAILAKGGYVKGYASGGLVTGGSGYKDDVPARLSSGEYVLRQSAVKKYGVSNLEKLNSGGMGMFAAGGFFLPGVRGQTEISGYKDLTAFAKQTTTSGATDVLMGGRSTAFANLEDQSQRLSAYALLNEDDIINQEIRSAQEQGLNIVKEREVYRTAQRKAFQQGLKKTAISALLSFGASKLTTKIPYSSTRAGMEAAGAPTALAVRSGLAYGGLIQRYNTGGSPTDDVPALLMGGEYVMSRQATKKYGKQFFDSLNQGRSPRFADGGQVSTSEPSFAEKAAAATESKAGGANVSININVTGGTADTQTEGDTKQNGTDYKKMGEQIKQIVIQTINEEKRLGGSLRGR